MKQILYALVVVVFFSCTPPITKKPPTSPLIITYKDPNGSRCNGECCNYEYTDADSMVVLFCGDEDDYMIGDTIKFPCKGANLEQNAFLTN